MRHFLMAALAVAIFGFAADDALASADGSCYPGWRISNPQMDCASIPAISPGNDTRVNLLLLMLDGKRQGSVGYPELGWDKSYGRNYFNWTLLRKAYAPVPEESGSSSYYGSRCQSFESGTRDFNDAVLKARKLSDRDRAKLRDMRTFLADVCDKRGYRGQARGDLTEVVANAVDTLAQVSLNSDQAREFLSYLQATNRFYAGEYDLALARYAPLAKSNVGWVREASRYMTGRSHINAALKNAFDKWGFFGGIQKADAKEARAAEKAFSAYLAIYPEGQYAQSARGLIRRAHWLSGDLEALSDDYHSMLTGAASAGAKADVIEEIDNKLLFEKDAAKYIGSPELLAAVFLMRMRPDRYEADGLTPLSLAEMERQRSIFKGREDLYSFLLANHALYVDGKARKVLDLIPDAARQDSFTALQFSRQALRGTALAVLNDRNEGGFWRDMLGGAKGLYQRPMAELGLAIFYEKNGDLDKVFAADSPITTSDIREILLQHVAGPAILRAAALNARRPQHERDVALFVLLHRQLSRGDYAGFLSSQKLIPARADKTGGLFALHLQSKVPVGLFSDNGPKGDYDCPGLRSTAATLARSATDIDARLCLGDFWLENGFDYYSEATPDRTYRRAVNPMTMALGSSKSRFPGTATPRHDIYTAIIANSRASAQQRSYALYRAIKCYATAGSNSCGGKAVPQSQRKTWFTTLKRQYGDTKWAKELKYYW